MIRTMTPRTPTIPLVRACEREGGGGREREREREREMERNREFMRNGTPYGISVQTHVFYFFHLCSCGSTVVPTNVRNGTAYGISFGFFFILNSRRYIHTHECTLTRRAVTELITYYCFLFVFKHNSFATSDPTSQRAFMCVCIKP